MSGCRQDVSTLGLIVAALLTVTGWLLTFTDVGAALMLFGWAFAVAAALFYPSRRRFMAAAVIVFLFWWYAGLLLAAVFVLYEIARARRTSAN